MPLISKQTAVRLLARHPAYRLLPPGGLRTCAVLLYQGEHAPRAEVARLASRIGEHGGIPTRFLAPALAAARAAFRVGQDDLVEQALAGLTGRFPEAPGPHVLRADLATYRGEYEPALAAAEQARLVRPTHAPATARVVRIGYRLGDLDRADAEAVAAIGRFPRTPEVLWAVCKECASPAQYARLWAAWQAAVDVDRDLPSGVRPLSLAAARAGLVDEAVALYRRAIPLLAGTRLRLDAGASLGGRAAWHAIEDLCQVLDQAGVPFFFAAGTALGLVREGRPLAADSDIDVGILDQDWDFDRLVELFTRDPRFDLDLHPQSKKVSLRHRGGSPVDVFPFYQDGGKVWHDGVFVRWHNSPLEVTRHEVRGLKVPLPADPDRYLVECYGDGWRTPDPEFDAFTEDAPNLTVTWPEYHRLHFLRRAYLRLAAGDHTRAAADLALAGAADLAGATTPSP